MLRLALESVVARKRRLVSTSISVAIGVAFLAGTMVLLDTITAAFDDLFAELGETVDVVVRSDDVLDTGFGEIRGPVPASVLDDVQAIDGVAAAQLEIQGYAQLIDADGAAIGNPGRGAPTFGFNWSSTDELNAMTVVEGDPPVQPDEVVIDRTTADIGPFAVGDRVTVLLEGGPEEFVVAGIARFGEANSLLGATTTFFTLETAQRVLGEAGLVDSISVAAEPGLDQGELARRIDAVLPAGAEAVTGATVTEESQDAVGNALSFFNTFMLVFAGISLFVAAFIIYNTFSILVAQRTRELGLLRALGAGKLQITGSVLVEAVVLGLVASAVGVVAGLGVARLLTGLLGATGFEIPTSGVRFAPRTAYLGMATGLIVTVVAALIPSRRAARVSPMAAMRVVSVEGERTPVARFTIGAIGLVGGIGLLLWAMFGSPPNRGTLIGVGAAAVFLGVAALSPLIVPPFVALVGAVVRRLTGLPGEIAVDNAARNPTRTSTTASALMIGVGLVGAITVFASSASASIDKVIDDTIGADLVVDSGTFGFGGLSTTLADDIDALPEVASATGLRFGFAELDGEALFMTAVDPETMVEIVDPRVVLGDLAAVDERGLAVHDEVADEQGWALGDAVELRFADSGLQRFEVAALFSEGELIGDYFISHEAYAANYDEIFDAQIYIMTAPGVDPGAARSAVEQAAAPFATADVLDLQEYKAEQTSQINQLLSLIYALLGLAIIIALIGIANTLGLSILERTRELGLLRALGMTRRQLRASLRWESVLIALLGTGLGVVVGVFFGWMIVRALADEGITEFRLPVTQIVIAAIVAVAAGVVAAVRPARRAAKLEVLQAVAAQ